jgi:hypothetical protein
VTSTVAVITDSEIPASWKIRAIRNRTAATIASMINPCLRGSGRLELPARSGIQPPNAESTRNGYQRETVRGWFSAGAGR